MNILTTIIEQKKKEVAAKKQNASIDASRLLNVDFNRKAVSLKEKLIHCDLNIIAEFKRKSPSRGWMNKDIFIGDVIQAYEAHGAAAISVLTDKEFFGGGLEELKEARAKVQIPLLRKDFIIDEFQLYEAKSYGADIILLIAACLSKEEVKCLAKKAKELQLEVLLEIHSEEEVEYICDEVDIVGVNNRNLDTFITDVQTSINLATHLPADKPYISESGITDVETIITLHNHGFKGFLIGETFMKAQKPAVAFAEFMKTLRSRAAGLMKGVQ